MKKTIAIYISFWMISISATYAQNAIFLVQSNSATNIYTDLDEAIDSAAAGSIIYIPAGNFSINNAITKELHLRGAGVNPNFTGAIGETYISVSSTGNTLFYIGSDGSTVEGITFNTRVLINASSSSTKLENIVFTKCFFTDLLLFDNLDNTSQGNIIKQSIITEGYFEYSSVTISNCIIKNHLDDLGNSVIENCIFLEKTYSPWCPSSGFCSSAYPRSSIFKNCIFRTTTHATANSGGNNIYQHNLYMGSSSSVNFPTGSLNNMFVSDLDSMFVNYGSSEEDFYFNFDYHLQSSSIGINAGSDGTNVGIYGGSTPFVEGSIPSYPYIQSKSIPSNTDGSGNLRVQFTVEARDN